MEGLDFDCPRCHGHGYVLIQHGVRPDQVSPCDSEEEVPCERCKGTGEANEEDTQALLSDEADRVEAEIDRASDR